MNSSFFISWFAVMLPLVLSPGPANIMFAATGAKFGIKESLPLMIGIDLVFVLQSLLIGYGMGTIFDYNSIYLGAIQIFGSLYLFYLAYTFLLPVLKKNNDVEKKLGFIDGIIIQLLNVKGWLLIVLMFSLFSNIGQDANTFLLVFMLFILNISCHLLWISLSSLIYRFFCHNSNFAIQNILFSLSLFLVGVWLIIENEFVQSFFNYN